MNILNKLNAKDPYLLELDRELSTPYYGLTVYELLKLHSNVTEGIRPQLRQIDNILIDKVKEYFKTK